MNNTTALVALKDLVCSTRWSLHNLVHKGGPPLGDELGQPEYRRLMQDLRRQIAEGQLQVGQPIPSTVTLGQQYGVSSTVVRRAVSELRSQGLLYGHPGKGVFVKAKPDDVVNEQSVLEHLASGLEDVQSKVNNLHEADAGTLEAFRRELADLRRIVAVLQTQLIDLYGRMGQPYPRDAAPLQERPSDTERRRAAGS
ncbi:GntR family transcriptional regulator [Streptomyces sp. NPDC059688]|uniref:GntR family transcriptional regulator n=1 Tax=Streptomyces sp. NPDC059688 TaxID=3346906 RepID=UPI0036C8BFAE